MKPIGGIVISLYIAVIAVVGGPLSIWDAIGQGDILAAAAMLLLGIPFFLWFARAAYRENGRVAVHRRRLRKNRPIRYYVGKSIRGLGIVSICAIGVVDVMYLGIDPMTEVKFALALLVMASMMSIGGSMAAAGVGRALRS